MPSQQDDSTFATAPLQKVAHILRVLSPRCTVGSLKRSASQWPMAVSACKLSPTRRLRRLWGVCSASCRGRGGARGAGGPTGCRVLSGFGFAA
eukprot:15478050-Alexandrium_andersonii.AAC.1